MGFLAFAKIVIEAIRAATDAIAVSRAFISHREEKERITKSEWLKFCKMFKRYITEHPEEGIEVIEPVKKGEATKYQIRED